MRIANLLAATALSGLLLVPAMASAQTTSGTSANDAKASEPAAAQTAIDRTEDPTESTAPTDVIVTGSRIRRPNLDSPIPITSISGQQVFEQGRSNLGDTLNDLPQLRSTFAQQNPGAGVGIAGLNLLDLRGLGTVRTLVLVNNRRHVPSDVLNNATSVDINSIPDDLIDRIDIITGGNSAVYGSDAVAGVVNFVLKRDFNGLQLRGTAATAEAGFGGNQFVSALAGHNFAEGRGNITVSGEYAHQDRVFGSDIPWYQRVDGFAVTDVDPAGLTGNSDGFPDRSFFRDIRSTTASIYGLVPVNQATATPTCGTGLGATNGASGTTGGTPYSCNYIFTQAGRLVQETGTRVGSGPNGSFIGGNGPTGREGQLLSVYPKQDRYNVNVLAHYEFAPAVEAFLEAKYSRVDTRGSNLGPSFSQGTYAQFDYRERVRLDNPFLNAADSTALGAAILASGCNTSLTVTCGTRQARADGGVIGGALSAADRTAIANGSYRFVLAKNFFDAGIRDEQFERNTYRIVGGLRGTFNNDWNYEVSANYGRFTQTTTTLGYFDKQRFLLSYDAGRNPTTGQIQCRSQFDPAARVSYPNTSLTQARLAADIAACVPYNPFGGTADNVAAAKYFNYNEVDHARITQLDFSGYLSGDTSGFFNLPGGPVGFSVGGEYRREKTVFAQDPFAGDPALYTNALGSLSFAPPAFEVKEGYGELQLPLLKDITLIKELSLSGAGRVSDYRGSTGTVYTYNYGGVYKPFGGLTLRANYGRSIRAPNVTETAGALTPNFSNGFSDPCRKDAIGTGSQYRAANCRTDLGALVDNATFANQPTYSLKVLSGSNPNLQAEKSDSYTYGAVFQPSFIRNFSLSVDYFNIKVNGVITAVTAQQIANSCYDLATLNNPFCGLFQRNKTGATGSDSESPGQILSNSLIQAPLNYARLERKGIDSQASYRFDISSDVSIATNVNYTHMFKYSSYTNPQDPTFENRQLSELGNPTDEFQIDTDLRVGQVTFGYRAHLIAAAYLNTYEDFNTLGGRAPENADYADTRNYPIITYHALRVEWDLKNDHGIGRDFQFYAGVDNVFDQHPPLGSTGTGPGSSIYDIRGRNLYAGFRVRY